MLLECKNIYHIVVKWVFTALPCTRNLEHLVTSTLLLVTPSLHFLCHAPLSLSLLRLGSLPPQPDGNLLPHLAILEQHADVSSASDDLLPVRLGDLPGGDDGAGLGARPRDLGLSLHNLAQVDRDGHVGVGGRARLGAVLLDDDGAEGEVCLAAGALDGSGVQDQGVGGVGALVDDEVGQVFGGDREGCELVRRGCGRGLWYIGQQADDVV